MCRGRLAVSRRRVEELSLEVSVNMNCIFERCPQEVTGVRLAVGANSQGLG